MRSTDKVIPRTLCAIIIVLYYVRAERKVINTLSTVRAESDWLVYHSTLGLRVIKKKKKKRRSD